MKMDRKFKNLACLLKIEASDPTVEFPDKYSIALIDLEIPCPKFPGTRVEGIDREPKDHHRAGAQCHRHYFDGMGNSSVDFIGDLSFPKSCTGSYPTSISHICEVSCVYFCKKNANEYNRFFEALSCIENQDAYEPANFTT